MAESKLFIPSKRMINCEHREVREQRIGGRCENCGQKVFLTVIAQAWLTLVEQEELRRAERGVVSA